MTREMKLDRAQGRAVKAASAVALILVAVLFAILISPAGRLGVASMLAAPLMPARVAPPPTTIMQLVVLARQGHIKAIHLSRARDRMFLIFPVGHDDPSFTALTDRNTVLTGYVPMGEDLRLVLRQQGVRNVQALVSGP
jgi:hypothetical protein